MTWRRLCILLAALSSCGWLCQLVVAQATSKQLPVNKPAHPPQVDGRDWINPTPNNWFAGGASQNIDDSDIYEVIASKNHVPIVRDLKGRTHAKLTPDEAIYFTGHYFKCPNGKSPYLVRAVYANGGTGKYLVMRSGRKLLVYHGSLGRTVVRNKSALIVNLDFEPEVVYTDLSVAE